MTTIHSLPTTRYALRVPFGVILPIVACVLTCHSPLFSQELQLQLAGSTSPSSETVDAKTIEAGLQEVAENGALDETLKASLQDLYHQAQQNLQATQSSRQNADRFELNASTAADRIREATAEIQKQPTAAKVDVSPETTVETIKQELAATKAKGTEASEQFQQLSTQSAERQKRLAEIPAEQTKVEKELETTRDQLAREVPANETPVQTRARMTQLRSRRESLEAKLNELQKELKAYAVTTDLLPLQTQIAQRQVQKLNAQSEQLQSILSERQRDLAADRVDNLRKDLALVPALLKPMARENIEIAERLHWLVTESAKAAQLMSESQEWFEEVKSAKEKSKERLEKVGLTDALGLMLRNKRDEFESLKTEFRPHADLRQRIEKYQISVFELEDQLQDVQTAIKQWNDTPDASRRDAEQRRLLEEREQLLSEALQAQKSLLQTMLSADTNRRELRLVIDEYIELVDQNVFWIRSAPAFSLGELKNVLPATVWLMNASHWQSVGDQLPRGLMTRPIASWGGCLVVLALFLYRPRLRKTLVILAKEATRFDTTFVVTAKALLITAMLAIAWPALFGLIGWLLLANPSSDPFVLGVGEAFVITAIYIASRELMKEVCRVDGLAEIHFGWDEAIRTMLRFHLRWYTAVGGILIFLIATLNAYGDPTVRETMLRLISIALFIMSALFHSIVFSVRSPIFVQTRRDIPESKSYRWRRVIWGVTTGLPLLFAVMSFSGFLDTAFTLGKLLQFSMLLLVSLLLVMALTFRVLSLHYRDVSRRQAIQRRDKKLSAASSAHSDGLAGDVSIELQEEQTADLPKLDRDTRQLVYVITAAAALFGLSYLWSDVLPAIKIFDRIELWNISIGETVEPVTLRDILYIIGTIVAALFAVRNLPSLLELFILRRTSFDSGARYALTTILRYALIVTAAIIVLNLLSVPWTQLGWLLAAASVGLGFGLQEIVANFVSGIILLLERPVRVGDVVTIDGTTGIVSRIQMRATTVTSWDRKELVVPNKDLITEKLLNWSLSNVVNRLTLQIGVDYDSDLEQVQAILQRVVTEHPDVMDDPPPLINFDTFGDSSLNFTIRFFLANLDRRIGVTHEINIAIMRAFREAGISIPFPQHDVHMKP
ncbi:mechanosensitive ion channel domain-containing protein [Novipirellula artificiosorum]|nr:mechanosensitive ion channel domain-containing protein [Novipirellula artificiosorum]